MAKVSGGALAAQVMKNDGVKHLFGLVGGHIYPIIEGCVEMGIRVILDPGGIKPDGEYIELDI